MPDQPDLQNDDGADRAPADRRSAQNPVFKCRLCGKTEQIVIASDLETVTSHPTNDVS
jgi:hypothetical protein